MKTEGITIADAFAWDKQVLCMKLMMENNKSFIAFDMNIAKVLDDDYRLTYYSDAVKLAVTEYIIKKKCVLDRTIKIIMTVKTKDGVEHPYNIVAGGFFGTASDIDTLQQDIAKPSAFKLVRVASMEIKFADVDSVSCYVEEVDMDKQENNNAEETK